MNPQYEQVTGATACRSPTDFLSNNRIIVGGTMILFLFFGGESLQLKMPRCIRSHCRRCDAFCCSSVLSSLFLSALFQSHSPSEASHLLLHSCQARTTFPFRAQHLGEDFGECISKTPSSHVFPELLVATIMGQEVWGL